ncbi:MAG: GHKL domain-containing protein [Eubacteriales bacterium]|nr:GHKL domain-containing protein [Eubacteriales bacterium]
MSAFMLVIFVLKFFIPGFFSVLFRAYGLGYKSKKSLLLGLTVYTIFAAGLSAVLITVIGYGEFTHISPIVMAASSMAVLLFTTDRISTTIFLQLLQGCMNTAVSVLLNLIRTVFSLSYPMLVAMIAVVFPLLYFVALRYWAKPLRFMADHIHAELPSLIAIPLIINAIVSFLPTYPPQSFSRYPVYITAMMLAVELAYFLFVYTFYQNLRQINRLLREEAKGQLLEAEILSYQESLEIARQTRHDLRHHNALVLDYLENGDTAGAMSYLRQNDHALETAQPKRFSVNPTANAVLRIYSRKAQEAGIFFDILVDLPEVLPLSAPELGALLSNLLENAMDACEKVEPAHRRISFSTRTDEHGLRLEIRNSVAHATAFVDGMPLSIKPGGGMGTKSISRMIKTHGGMLRFGQENDTFFTQILLPLKR